MDLGAFVLLVVFQYLSSVPKRKGNQGECPGRRPLPLPTAVWHTQG